MGPVQREVVYYTAIYEPSLRQITGPFTRTSPATNGKKREFSWCCRKSGGCDAHSEALGNAERLVGAKVTRRGEVLSDFVELRAQRGRYGSGVRVVKYIAEQAKAVRGGGHNCLSCRGVNSPKVNMHGGARCTFFSSSCWLVDTLLQ